MSEEEIETEEENNFNKGVAKYSTVQEPDKPIVNETKFYPATNDAIGINAAIIAANEAGGGTVELSEMTYLINEPITLKSNVSLVGQGIGKTMLERGAGFQTSTSGYFVGAYDAGVSDVEIRLMSINGGYSREELASDPTVLVGIGFKSSSENYNERIRIVFCEIEGCTIGIQMSGTTHITVENCNVHDNGGTYLHHNVYFRRIGHVLFYNNEIYDSVGGSGLKLAGGTSTVYNESLYFTIRNNKINNNERINLNIQGCNHILIEGNELKKQKSTVNAMAGMFLKAYNGYQCNFTDIINNTIIDNTLNGVYVDGCESFNIEGNACSANGINYNILNSTLFTCDYNN